MAAQRPTLQRNSLQRESQRASQFSPSAKCDVRALLRAPRERTSSGAVVARRLALERLERPRRALGAHGLLRLVASSEMPPAERGRIDAALSADAVAMKGSLLKALKVCDLHRAFLGLPALMEQTRRLLAAAPCKAVGGFLEDELCSDVSGSTDARAIMCVKEARPDLCRCT